MQNRYSKLIVAVFLLLQLVILFVCGYTPYPDCEGYIAAASEALGQGSPYPSPSQLYSLDFIWNLGSINAVELSLWLTGSVYPLLVVYAILKALTAWFVYGLARHLIDETTAMLALLIYVLYPANYGEATSVLSELPFIFFVVFSLWLSVVKRRTLLGGIVLAIANWFRPMGIVFLVAAIILILTGMKRKSSPTFKDAVKIVVGYCLAILIIGMTTRLYSGRFMYQAQTGWMALMQYSWDNDSDQTSDTILFRGGNPMLIADKERLDGKERDSQWLENFALWIAGGNFGEYLSQMPRKLAETFVSDNVNMCAFVPDKATSEYMYDEVSMRRLATDFPQYSGVQWLTVVNLLFYYLLMVFYVIAILTMWRRGNNPADILSLTIVVFGTLVLMFFGHGEARFHQPFMPFIIVSVATMIVDKTTRRNRHRR